MLRIDSLIPTATSLEDPFADPTPSVFQSLVPVIVIDNTPLPSIAMIAVKIYVFGGLGFIIGVVLVAIAYWIWVVVIKREYADSPPWLDLHPEVRLPILLFSTALSHVQIADERKGEVEGSTAQSPESGKRSKEEDTRGGEMG